MMRATGINVVGGFQRFATLNLRCSSAKNSATTPAPSLATRNSNRSELSSVAKSSNKNRIVPRNEKQRRYIELLSGDLPCVVIAHGSTGSGKTKLAVDIGVKSLIEGRVQKLIITRPAITVDEESHGFLPGNLDAKMKPMLFPIFDELEKHFDALQIDRLMKSRIIEIAPLAYMRGRTFENAWIVCDEAQNMTPSQMLMMLTRIGNNSKIVITGDPLQHDRNSNGLSNLINMYQNNPIQTEHIEIIEFEQSDVARHPLIPFILDMYMFNSANGV